MSDSGLWVWSADRKRRQGSVVGSDAACHQDCWCCVHFDVHPRVLHQPTGSGPRALGSLSGRLPHTRAGERILFSIYIYVYIYICTFIYNLLSFCDHKIGHVALWKITCEDEFDQFGLNLLCKCLMFAYCCARVYVSASALRIIRGLWDKTMDHASVLYSLHSYFARTLHSEPEDQY